MASFVLSFFQIDVLDEIRDLIESVSEGFLTYYKKCQIRKYYPLNLALTFVGHC